MKSENKEILAGVVLVLLLGVCLLFAHAKAVHNKKESAFVLFAPFNQSDGLMNGADVRIAGIKVGKVVDQVLNNNYQVQVKMEFFKPMEISIDSSVVIETDGLLGSKYLEILPGGEEEVCSSGDELEYTQDALVLTQLMDKVNAHMREKKRKEKELAKNTQVEETKSEQVENMQQEQQIIESEE
ncbi:MAG: MCE family protein [Alphaproteobacteria bacterium]|nr:MCE family protein [Alphaproteobacteria bacterium]